MLAEENKNAGTSALEGKEVFLHPAPFAFAPLLRRQSLLIKRGERKQRGARWDLKRESLGHKTPRALQ